MSGLIDLLLSLQIFLGVLSVGIGLRGLRYATSARRRNADASLVFLNGVAVIIGGFLAGLGVLALLML